uniref:Uncharacterized protein n=1 Tax=Rhizophora mucronata TaxID=61149 RepID=A0A2P2IZA2_RHIMU
MCSPFGASTLGNFISVSPPISSHLQSTKVRTPHQ